MIYVSMQEALLECGQKVNSADGSTMLLGV